MTDRTESRTHDGGAPLSGIRVLEVGNYMAGPYCGMQLADLGADVIKVEQPDGGDQVRLVAPLVAGEGSAFIRLNRNKRSIAIDLKTPEGKDIFRKLATAADVVVENLRPGTMNDLGLDYPTLRGLNRGLIYAADGTLVSPEDVDRAFPRIPGVPAPSRLLNPLLDYDLGPAFDPNDMRGSITMQPPTVRRVLRSWVPKVDSDGNETAGARSPLFQNPLGSYVGWNVSAAGFAKGQSCGFNGGFIPFARTRAERLASGDPRPSLEERYSSAETYLQGVAGSARSLVTQRLLLQEDADRILSRARVAHVLPSPTDHTERHLP